VRSQKVKKLEVRNEGKIPLIFPLLQRGKNKIPLIPPLIKGEMKGGFERGV
jgi:hypothetical protein